MKINDNNKRQRSVSRIKGNVKFVVNTMHTHLELVLRLDLKALDRVLHAVVPQELHHGVLDALVV